MMPSSLPGYSPCVHGTGSPAMLVRPQAKVDQFIDAASDVFSPIGMTIQSDNYGLGAVLPSDKDEQAKVCVGDG